MIRRITKEASVTPLMMKIFFSLFFIITIGDVPKGDALGKNDDSLARRKTNTYLNYLLSSSKRRTIRWHFGERPYLV